MKTKIVELLTAEGENWIGCGMTYTLFECIKEQLNELFDELENDIKSGIMNQVSEDVKKINLSAVIKTTETPVAVKKEQLTKTQKRRMWERTDNKGQRQRGWDWVDVIRHLSQTGQKEEAAVTTQTLIPPPNN